MTDDWSLVTGRSRLTAANLVGWPQRRQLGLERRRQAGANAVPGASGAARQAPTKTPSEEGGDSEIDEDSAAGTDIEEETFELGDARSTGVPLIAIDCH